MKMIIEAPNVGEENQIILKCNHISPEILQFLDILKSQNKTLSAPNKVLVAYVGKTIHRIPPTDIYYIRATGNKTFLYDGNKMYESKKKLYELEKYLLNDNFMRISKSGIVNLSKIRSITSGESGRLEAVLLNREMVKVSRQYAQELKRIWTKYE